MDSADRTTLLSVVVSTHTATVYSIFLSSKEQRAFVSFIEPLE